MTKYASCLKAAKAFTLVLLCLFAQGNGRLAKPVNKATHRRKLQSPNADYTLLNSLLGDLFLQLDTSGVEDVRFDNPFTTLDATFGEEANVSGLGIEQVVIGVDTSTPNEYTINLDVDTLLFEAVIGIEILCVSNCGGFDGNPGTLTITSNAGSASTLELPLILEGTDFNTGPPTGARLGSTCEEALDLSGITFAASDLGTTTIRVFIFNIVIELGPTVEDTLADDPSLGIDAIVGALCGEIEPLIENLTDFLVNNPATNGELFPPQSIATALAAEQELVNALPPGTSLLDLNTLVTSSPVVLDDSSSIVAALLNLLNLTDTGEGWIVTALEALLGIDIAGSGGALDIVEAAASFLDTTEQGVFDILQFEFEVPGSIEVSFSTVDASASLSALPTSLDLDVVGDNSMSLSASAGDISLSGDFELGLYINVAVLGLPIHVNLTESFSLSLDVQSISATIAAFLPVDGSLTTTVEALLATLFSSVGCSTGVFVGDPALTASILEQQGVTVGSSGIQDGILFTLVELVSAVLPAYAYVVGQALGAVMNLLLNPVFADLVCV